MWCLKVSLPEVKLGLELDMTRNALPECLLIMQCNVTMPVVSPILLQFIDDCCWARKPGNVCNFLQYILLYFIKALILALQDFQATDLYFILLLHITAKRLLGKSQNCVLNAEHPENLNLSFL